MIKINIPIPTDKATGDLITDWVDRVNRGGVVGELNPQFGDYGTALHYLRIANILDSNIAIHYIHAEVDKGFIRTQVEYRGDHADRLLELQMQDKILYKPRGVVISAPSMRMEQPTIVTFDMYVDVALLSKDSKESLKAEADHWILTAKQEAKLWRDFF